MNDNFGLEEFLKKYDENFIKRNLTEDLKMDAIKAILDEVEYKVMCYKDAIRSIYQAIIAIKYFKDDMPDIGMITSLISGVMYMNQHRDANGIKYYNIPKICKEVYEEFRKEFDYLEEEMPEEFKEEHLFDLKYHLDNFIKWSNGEKEFNEVLDKELWRYIRNVNI